mmetsp:Transcript_19533/g.50038  ORF Transcript_19533/g.50038 Transcript_19533/m.50038 type:complete len:163 (-) Transcript_19533:773-1261(-)
MDEIGFEVSVASECRELADGEGPIKTLSFQVPLPPQQGAAPAAAEVGEERTVDCSFTFFSNVIEVCITETGKSGVVMEVKRKEKPGEKPLLSVRKLIGRGRNAEEGEMLDLYAEEVAKLFLEGAAKEGFGNTQSVIFNMDIRSSSGSDFKSIINAIKSNFKL